MSNAEFAYIEWLRSRTPTDSRVRIGPGDDCAAVEVPTHHPLLVTTDMLLEGSCFRLAEAGPLRVGRKSIAVNLSDIAAMAGIPLYAVVSVGLPHSLSRSIAEELYLAMREMAEVFGTAIVGGDTNAWDGPLSISVTLIGQATERGPVRRNGAKPGDWLLVTGELGGSILGHHLDFMPRVRESLQLHALSELHAMIDISDGFTADLWHICEESRCGAVVFADRVPVADAARQLAVQDGRPPLEHAFGDGEDFELIVAVSPEDGERLIRTQPIAGTRLSHVGECVPAGLWIEHDGERRMLAPTGYVHRFGA